jgi:hypothetical protein
LTRATGIEISGFWCRLVLSDLCTAESKRRPIPGGVFAFGGGL